MEFLFKEDVPTCFYTVNDSNIGSLLRTNGLNSNRIKVLQKYLSNNQPFYIYYTDGVNWGNIPYWIKSKTQCISICYYFYNMTTYKDAVCKYADEFLIFDTVYHKDEIAFWNQNHEEQITTVILHCADYSKEPSYLIDYIKQLMINAKKTKEGAIYEYSIN